MEFFANLTHQMALLAIDPRNGRVRDLGHARLAATGTTLAELAMQERVTLIDKKVQVRDLRPTGDPLVDALLRVLATHGDRKPVRIIQGGGKFYLDQSLDDLTSAGWVVKTPGSGLRGDRYRIVNGEALNSARDLAVTALYDPVQASPRAVCLGGLAVELRLGKTLAFDIGWRQRAKAQKVLCQRDWVVKAVHDLIASEAAAASA
ncbi:GPP34 family phosphoprotein [Propionimicrobium sp. PCR01-08-3]|uniref:GOLPH3/VPS74 family protein n=1 Tax=Propionimicrobium sp. PCR01-08-3 TaxID=3052086 RepID=UPI00255C6543|nr:GPP34 family phosphoprotein [Propionimicrobium sp. PCR01-08-3]WIY84111.1 GPP34 family phosphoprotein [Propionimicrobium sp. PCR01-08-3]